MKNNHVLCLLIFFLFSSLYNNEHLYAQCYGIKDIKQNKIEFKGTYGECQNKINEKIRNCSRSNSKISSNARQFMNSFGGVGIQTRNSLIKVCENEIKNSYKIIQLGDDCNETTQPSDFYSTGTNSSTSTSNETNYDALRQDFNTAIEYKQQQGEIIRTMVENDPQYTKSSSQEIGARPSETKNNISRPTFQIQQCDFAQKIGDDLLTKFAEGFIAQWIEYSDWNSNEFQQSYSNYTHKIYDEYNRDGCSNRDEDYALFCEKLKYKVMRFSKQLQSSIYVFNPEVDMPALCNDVYNTTNNAPTGWKRLFSFDQYMGFFAALYQNTYDSTIYVLSFRGTDPNALIEFSKDAIVDMVQALFGVFDAQYSQATEVTNNVLTNFIIPLEKHGAKLYLTGHSLGGGLASYAHVTVSNNSNIVATYIYNAAGINKLKLSGIEYSDENIYAYHTQNDFLTFIQNTANKWIYLHQSLSFVPFHKKIFSKNSEKRRLILLGNMRTIPINTGHSINKIQEYYNILHGIKIQNTTLGNHAIRNNLGSMNQHIKNDTCLYR